MPTVPLVYIMMKMVTALQLSIVVPMIVVWLRKNEFPPAIKLLSWYVYLSALCALGAHFTEYTPNSLFIIGFSTGKIALFGAVYYLVLESARARQVVLLTTLTALVVCIGLTAMGFVTNSFDIAVAGSRVTQSAVLAAFALVYLEQMLSRAHTASLSRDPIWLLSVGQLLYSAGTVTAFSLDYLSTTRYEQAPKWIFISIIGIIFNVFLTLAFLRARKAPQLVEGTKISPTSQLAQA